MFICSGYVNLYSYDKIYRFSRSLLTFREEGGGGAEKRKVGRSGAGSIKEMEFS